MPQGFTTLRSSALTTNSFGQNQNCYYCTVAALLGISTSELVGLSETMMQDTAGPDEIVALMTSAGIPGATYLHFTTLPLLEAAVGSLPSGQAVGLAYTRTNGTGHMIVVARNATGQFGFIDYQASPPSVTATFPEPIHTVTSMHLFFRA